MGPYYRGTTQATGAFFDMFYRHPVLMLLLIALATGIGGLLWYMKKSGKWPRQHSSE